VQAYPTGEEYQVRPGDNVLPVLKNSPRAILADHVASGKSQAFNQNIANRLWALMMGRGLVHPVDLHHPDNPPISPELMNLLATSLVEFQFDSKKFLREIALTKAYQRSIDLPNFDPSLASEVALKLQESKSKSKGLNEAVDKAKAAYDEAIKAWHTAETAMIAANAPVDAPLAKFNESGKARDAAAKALSDAQVALATKRDIAKAVGEASAKAQDVVKKLPEDKELAAAALKFAEKLKLFTTEIAGLEKAVVDKPAALKKTSDALVPLAKAVDEAKAKGLPSREIVRQKEAASLAARVVLSTARIAAETEKRRARSLDTLSQYLSLKERAATGVKAIQAKLAALKPIETEVKQVEAKLKPIEQSVQTSLAEMAKLEKVLADINGFWDQHQRKLASLAKAIESAEVAARALDGDATVAEIVQKLKAKSQMLETQTAEPKAKRETAIRELANQAEKLKAAKLQLAAAMGEVKGVATRQEALRTSIAADEAQQKTLLGEIASAEENVATTLANEFRVAQMKPLTPDQFAWSVMKVSQVYDNYWAQEEAAVSKSKPLTDALKKDVAGLKARAIEIEQRVYDKLAPTLPAFIQAYAAGPGQPQNDFFATVDQALFVSNGGTVNSWIAVNGNNVTSRLIAEKDMTKAAYDLYMTIVSRPPTDQEIADVTKILTTDPKTKPLAAQELAWGLLMSTEFRFNH
jgi:chromosome segregation ATPase